jgi:DNA-directed RNA polymerase specialized sigma24 family protein
MNEKPKRTLPNGKSNPEYVKWWNNTPKGKAYRKTVNESEAEKRRKAEYEKTDKGKAMRKIATARWTKKNRRKKTEAELLRNLESQKKATMSGLCWGVVEDSFLLDNAGKITIKQIAEKLGRSIKSCEIRLHRLRLAEFSE